jgi:cytochrome b561
MRSDASKYGKIAQAFHWISALLIFAMLPMGLLMTRIADGATKNTLYKAHVAIGVLVLVLTILRIIWLFVEPRPETPPGLSPARAWVLKGVHVLLYALLLLLAVSGVGMLLGSGIGLSIGGLTPDAILRDLTGLKVHGITSKLYIALLIAHIGGVLQYQFTKSDVLSRMGVTWLKKVENQ